MVEDKEIKEEITKVLTWKCPRCEKTFRALYKSQLNAIIRMHKMKCFGGEKGT